MTEPESQEQHPVPAHLKATTARSHVCGNCKAAFATKDALNGIMYLQCRRRAPDPGKESPSYREFHYRSMWPLVLATDWCLEWTGDGYHVLKQANIDAGHGLVNSSVRFSSDDSNVI